MLIVVEPWRVVIKVNVAAEWREAAESSQAVQLMRVAKMRGVFALTRAV